MTIPKNYNKSFNNHLTYPGFNFFIKEIPNSKSLKNARRTTISTPHGTIETPTFIFCGTKATVKALPSHRLKALGTTFALANTYHLMLRPGANLIAEMGGLHTFMNFHGPLLTDSGGYQVFAMGYGSVAQEVKRIHNKNSQKSILKISEEGAFFRSYIDGKKILLTPELSIETQRKIGADFVVQLDECTPFNVSKEYTEKSTYLSMRWGNRSLFEFEKSHLGKQAIYGVIQGGIYPNFRKESTHYVKEKPFFGIAIGGSLGENKEQMYEVIDLTMNLLKSIKRPVHLLGIGDLNDIFFGVKCGIDSFDCVSPTRIARHSVAIVPASLYGSSTISLKNHQFKHDKNPIDQTANNIESQEYSRAYLHFLFKAKEITALEILTAHNIFQMNRLFQDIRKGIETNTLKEVEQFWLG